MSDNSRRNGTTGGQQSSPFLAQSVQPARAGPWRELPDSEQHTQRLVLAARRPSSAGVPSPPAFLSRATSAQVCG
jgi:hypothetical protein